MVLIQKERREKKPSDGKVRTVPKDVGQKTRVVGMKEINDDHVSWPMMMRMDVQLEVMLVQVQMLIG